MNGKEFEDALAAWLISFPTIELKGEQKTCLEILVVQRKNVLAILLTGFGKSLIYQVLPMVISIYWFAKTGEKKACTVIVVSPLELIRKQQAERLNSKWIAAAVLEELDSSSDLQGQRNPVRECRKLAI